MKIDLEKVVYVDESSLTIRKYRRRTTVPSRICEFLKLRDKDKLKWIMLKDGTVIIKKIGK